MEIHTLVLVVEFMRHTNFTVYMRMKYIVQADSQVRLGCSGNGPAHLSPDSDNVEHARVAQLCDDEVVVIVFGCFFVVWLQAANIPSHTRGNTMDLMHRTHMHTHTCTHAHTYTTDQGVVTSSTSTSASSWVRNVSPTVGFP